ncbi:MAG: metallophosphoesterase family protein [Bacilli bacterium]|nr:metallophosphoesterase family protein [Bacilli bacterium]
MDRIALISDIHSNIVALKAVLNDIEKRQINKIYCLGDLVLKGSSPCEVIDLIRQKCEIVLKGNCDAYAVNPSANHAKWYQDAIGEKRVKYLDNLPMYKDFYMSGSHIRMFHATKNNYKYKILDNSPLEEKMKLFEDEDNDIPDIVIYADTHKQFLEKIRNKTIINIGSVGNVIEISNKVNIEEDMSEMTQAHYCILEGELDSKERSSFSIQFVRLPYDIHKELELCRQNNIPDYDLYRLELLKAKYRKQN